MTIDKAFRLITSALYVPDPSISQDFYDAIELGSEALKRVKEARVKYHSVWGGLLPGETED